MPIAELVLPPLRAAVLADLVATLDAAGAWLADDAHQIVARASDRRPELEAQVLNAVRSTPRDGSTAARLPGLSVVEVAGDNLLLVAPGPHASAASVRAALRLAAAALTTGGADANTPELLTEWLADEPGPRSVFAVSIDELDAVTEAFGSQVSDAVADAVAARIDAWAGAGARTAEVVVAHALPMRLAARTDLPDIDAARAEAQALRTLLVEPVPVGASAPGAPELVSRAVTVGVAVDRRADVSAADLVLSAQRALGAGRAAGGDQVAVFVADRARRRHDRLRLELELEDATHGDQLRLHYQPEFDLRTGRIVAVEALVRWQHPRLGLLSADRFVPGTEHTHAFTAVQRWVIDRTCEQLAHWRKDGVGPELALRINASAAQVLTGTITEALLAARRRHGLTDATICIELTERMLPVDTDSVRRLRTVVDGWRRESVQVAIDDFGTGQGTLTHLLDLPLDVLKLDQTYVRRVGTDARAHAIVAHTVRLAADLGIATVVAEGVDSTTTVQTLLALGVHHAQGNFLAPASSAATISELLGLGADAADGASRQSFPPDGAGGPRSG